MSNAETSERSTNEPADEPSSSLPTPVSEELRLYDTVRKNLLRLKAGPARANHSQTMIELRDSLSGEKLVDDIASIVEAMDRTAALMAQQQKSTEGVVDPDNPYFGHMVLDDDFGRRSILVGRHTFLSDRVRIVDWRNAPVSRLFYQYAEGDEYDEVVNEQDVSGEVLVRRTVTIHDGQLRRVANDDHAWVLGRHGEWRDLRSQEAQLAGGAGAAVRPSNLGTASSTGGNDKFLPEIASLLDPAQFDLITRDDSGLVVIQGSAGSGKTTVGLHRIAYLAFHNPRAFRPKRMLVMVFSRGLQAYISKVLPALGVEGVKVDTYPRWAEQQRKHHFRGLPKDYADDTPALVSRFKSHTALLKMIDALPMTHKGQDPRTVFEEMFTDRYWMAEGLAEHAPDDFSEAQIEKIARWCSRQYHFRSEGGGPNDHEIPTLDREDDTLLLRIYQVLKGPLQLKRKQPLVYDHLLVDEAQDLSPIELAVLVGTTGKRQSVTLAGDVAQKVTAHNDFRSWVEVLEALQLPHVNVSPLQVSYRSTLPIMTVARDILGPLAPDEPIVAPRSGVPVAHLKFSHMGAAVAWLAPALTDLMVREPTSNVALLTVDAATAKTWYEVLERAEVPYVGLITEQDFSFAPGIEVTDIRSSKGLEFDYVILLGVDATAFPAQDSYRHLLHVGATRAAHQLWFVSTARPSPLIPDGLASLLSP